MRLSPYEVELSKAKFEKLRNRAVKKGFTGGLELVIGDLITETKKDEFGFTRTYNYHEVTIDGEPPKYDDWQFVARLDILESGNFIAVNAPGVDHVDITGIDPRHCSHCNIDRYRKNVYVVRNADGRQETVGSTCIKDFIGWDISLVWIDTTVLEGEIDDDVRSYRSGNGGERYTSVLDVLAYAYAATKTFGYVKASAYDGNPTKNVVISAIFPYSKNDRELAAALSPVAEEASGKAGEIRNFILSPDFNGDSDYVRNLKALCAEDEISVKHFGFVVSAPNAYIKVREAQVIQEVKADIVEAKPSEWLGAEKDKIEFSGTITSVRFLTSDFGTTVLYKFLTDNGDIVTWFASRDALGEEEGRKVKVKGTIKKCDEYNGDKQTVITRAREI